jgi:lipopolysaccharide export system permease protein
VRILRRHIGLTIILATLFVLLVLIGLQIFITFFAELDDIGRGNYNLWQAFIYIFLTLPSNVYEFFPMAGLLGSLLGLGHLASNSELIVMRASGVTLWGIIRSVLWAAFLMLIVATIIGEGVGPFASGLAQAKKNAAMAGGKKIANVTHGLWLQKDNDFIYIQSVIPGVALTGIMQYQFNDKHQMVKSSFAKTAVYRNKKWQLQDIYESNFHKKSVTKNYIKNQDWLVKLAPDLLQVSRDDQRNMTLKQLSRVIVYMRRSGLNIQPYLLSFYQRVFQPLATLVMIFLAVPFIFGPLRTVTMGSRILSGVVVGFMFYLANKFFGPFSLVYQIPPLIGAIMPSILFLIIGTVLMHRAKK